MKIRFRLNGKAVEVDAPPLARLLDVLREDLRLTGSKEGCGEGECGACSVLIDDEVVNSCLVPVMQVEDCRVVTVEGVARDDRLDAVQEALLEHGGAQCGICTPGMVIAGRALLDQNPFPSEAEAREAIAGNLCRCTGYQKIVDALVQGTRGGAP